MSGILGVFDREPGSTEDTAVRRMLAAMGRRGADRSALHRAGGATVAVGRFEWEMGAGFSDGALLAVRGGVVVAADASLFYRAKLRQALERAGVAPEEDTPPELILAAYRAWGAEAALRLEGDWAFILWDAARGRTVAACDFGGKRPLFFARVGGSLLIASTISALLAHPRCAAELDVAGVAADACGLFAHPTRTAYRSVSRLAPGTTLVADDDGLRTHRHWEPPPIEASSGPGFEEAALHLRELLQRSSGERLAVGGPTSVWLSGGWDSTAVFGAGASTLTAGEALRAVSISYPPGDPGREDELIGAVAARWESPVTWLDIGDIPLLPHPDRSAATRDEPFAHAFETGNRALAAGSRLAGSHVAWDGVGGDQLFQVTNVYLADLLRTLRWSELAREWRLKRLRGTGYRNFFRLAVQPLLPPPLLSLATVLRGGRPLRGYLERPLPEWIDRRFLARHRLVESESAHTPPRRGGSRADYETLWYLSHPYFPRAFGAVAEFALEAGVELRSPLYDARVIRFALSRPRHERSSGTETKRLLRRSMSGLLPEHILAPRARRTGVTSAYLDRSLRKTHSAYIEGVLSAPLRLAELGIVDPAALRGAWSGFLGRGGGELAVNLLLTLQAELWLRARA